MQNVFVSKIHIDKVRHLTNIDIVLSETERKHLIITGKNGSGKTSLLEAIRDYIYAQQAQGAHLSGKTLGKYKSNAIFSSKIFISLSTDSTNFFNQPTAHLFNTTCVYLPTERSKLNIPDGIKAFTMEQNTSINVNASKDFLQYILSLYVQYLSAKYSDSPEEAEYRAWFDRFTQNLREIYDCPELELKPNMKTLEFLIVMPDREPFGLHQMSDGYKALIEILMELLMRFAQADGTVDYAKPAIVIIDELETHLHVELQKRALPFLTTMFPSVQFIVSTHSPFVITSLPSAVVYDLKKHETLENPSYYSYESVVESFLDADMYSEAMKQEFNRYKELLFKERTSEENKEFLVAKTKLELMAPASKELYNAFQELEQQRKAAKNG
ncbi:MAG: AAA family ATPase [Deferribacteraceae bacterium]|jgi:predicted ATPase|nr:AAA family ATPase [Deferribacteraceae bacterium]